MSPFSSDRWREELQRDAQGLCPPEKKEQIWKRIERELNLIPQSKAKPPSESFQGEPPDTPGL